MPNDITQNKLCKEPACWSMYTYSYKPTEHFCVATDTKQRGPSSLTNFSMLTYEQGKLRCQVTSPIQNLEPCKSAPVYGGINVSRSD